MGDAILVQQMSSGGANVYRMSAITIPAYTNFSEMDTTAKIIPDVENPPFITIVHFNYYYTYEEPTAWMMRSCIFIDGFNYNGYPIGAYQQVYHNTRKSTYITYDPYYMTADYDQSTRTVTIQVYSNTTHTSLIGFGPHGGGYAASFFT